MANIYEFLLGLGAQPREIQQLMESLQGQQTDPLISRAPPGMRGNLATKPPARSQPQGVYRNPISTPMMGNRNPMIGRKI